MFFHILKRDLRRKKTMNTILLLFIIVASMFMASSITNIITVISGTDGFLDKAGVGDYNVVNQGDSSAEEMSEMLAKKEFHKDYRTEELIFATDNILTKDGEKVPISATSFIQCVEKMDIKLFTNEGEVVGPVKKGEVMLKRADAIDNDLKVGDKLTLDYSGVKTELTFVGWFKDAVFGSSMMGNSRVLISEEDYNKYYAVEANRTKFIGHIYYIDTDNVNEFKSELSNIDGVIFDAARSMISMSYVMEMLIAAVVLVIGIVLIIISFVVLKFMINFTISEEFREIGVMKAIGLKNARIRGLYVVKYIAFSVVGACIGLIISIPFGKVLLDVATANMMLSNDAGIILNVVGALLVIIITAAYAYHCTRTIKKSTPIDAIRNGQTGERYKQKKGYRIGKSHLKASGYMAVNDIKSAPKRYLTIVIAFCLCCLLTLIIGNTAATIKSGKLVHLFSVASCDLFFNETDYTYEIVGGTASFEDTLDNLSKQIADLGYPNKVFLDRQYKYNITSKGKEFNLTCEQGVNTKATDYTYTKGTAPGAANEIAITKAIADMIDAGIGDTVEIETSEGKVKCIVTAYFDTLNNLGTIIRIHEDFKVDNDHLVGVFAFQVKFDDNPTEAEINQRAKELEDKLGFTNVQDEKTYAKNTIGVADTMDALEVFLLAVMLVVVMFTTILMESSFISNEKGEIAMLKAVGFSQKSIMAWQVKRFGIVSIIAVVIAIVLSIPATNLCITPIFSMMGASAIEYTFDYAKAFAIYPAMVLIVTIIFTYITALKTRNIKANDTANIE